MLIVSFLSTCYETKRPYILEAKLSTVHFIARKLSLQMDNYDEWWRGGAVGRDGEVFGSAAHHCAVIVGKLCASVTKQYHLVPAVMPYGSARR